MNSRKIEPIERLKLWVKAGGRCAYPGCNRFLLKDDYMDYEWPLGDMGHIVAHSDDGPRANRRMPKDKRNLEKNLILLCPMHHRIIDRIAKKYGVDKVRGFKRAHEKEIHALTELSVTGTTIIVRMQGDIRGEKVAVTDNQIRAAVIGHASKMPGARCFEILLPNYEDKAEYWKSCRLTIDQQLKGLGEQVFGEDAISHLSVFAISRIPLLIYLGSRLSDKIQTDIYQKHRDGAEGWCWKKTGKPLKFKVKTHGLSSRRKAAIVLSLSAKINIEDLPANVRRDHVLYEISPENIEPNRNLLSSAACLDAFRQVFQKLLRKIESKHSKKTSVPLFAAVPVSAALTCGRELLKDVSPTLMVYDYINGKYKTVLEVSK